MDYKVKYEQAIADARAIIKDYKERHLDDIAKRSEEDFSAVFPELKESEDERIRQRIIHALHGDVLEMSEIKEAIDWLEKQGEKKPCMIQWKGDNLKEVIDFTGKDKNFEKWFKSFEEYEKYVGDHNGIFKLFNEDGSHYEVSVGAWIVKTPDGYNIASKAVLKQKSAVEWSEEDQAHLESIDESLFMFESGRHENVVAGIEDDRNWLKSLKSRVQPKQEWSKEDEEIRNNCIYWLEKARKYFEKDEDLIYDKKWIVKCTDWLKSLSPQNRWKPTKRQLESLEMAAKYYMAGKISKNYAGKDLTEILQQLNKLREE